MNTDPYRQQGYGDGPPYDDRRWPSEDPWRPGEPRPDEWRHEQWRREQRHGAQWHGAQWHGEQWHGEQWRHEPWRGRGTAPDHHDQAGGKPQWDDHHAYRPRRRRADASKWHWLLFIPILIPLATPLYNRVEPTWLGLPFFYWSQLSFALLASLVMLIVHLATKGGRHDRVR